MFHTRNFKLHLHHKISLICTLPQLHGISHMQEWLNPCNMDNSPLSLSEISKKTGLVWANLKLLGGLNYKNMQRYKLTAMMARWPPQRNSRPYTLVQWHHAIALHMHFGSKNSRCYFVTHAFGSKTVSTLTLHGCLEPIRLSDVSLYQGI